MEPIIINTPQGERKIGPGQPVFVIAEMSGNHNQSKEKAFELVDAAVQAGVDAIKLQTYTPDTLTIDCDNEFFQVKVNDNWKGKILYELYKEAHTPWEWQKELKEYGEKKGVLVFSTPFDEIAVDFLEQIDVELYKVASFETGDLELLKKIGNTKKPVIISRGLTDLSAIELAVTTLKEAGASQVAVLHCVSSYPAELADMNVATVPDITKRFNVVSGLSDHSLGQTASLTAVAMGAAVIEKHFTLARDEGGPDAGFSLEPQELKELVEKIREVEKVVGKPTYDAEEKEKENLVFRRSIFVIKDIRAGEEFTRENIRIIRPGFGLDPKELPNVLGRCASRDIKVGEPLQSNMINI